MRAQDIREGMTLRLKSERADGYGIAQGRGQYIYVSAIKYKPGYLTPWIWTADGRVFQPADFERAAVYCGETS